MATSIANVGEITSQCWGNHKTNGHKEWYEKLQKQKTKNKERVQYQEIGCDAVPGNRGAPLGGSGGMPGLV